MVRIVFSDIDGTLLTDDKRVTEKTEQAVKALLAKGIPFVLVRPACRRPSIPLRNRWA